MIKSSKWRWRAGEKTLSKKSEHDLIIEEKGAPLRRPERSTKDARFMVLVQVSDF